MSELNQISNTNKMKNILVFAALILSVLLVSSCASNKPYYQKDSGIQDPFYDDNIDFELFMVGDIGLESNTLGPDELISQIKSVMKSDNKIKL